MLLLTIVIGSISYIGLLYLNRCESPPIPSGFVEVLLYAKSQGEATEEMSYKSAGSFDDIDIKKKSVRSGRSNVNSFSRS
ncbi:hypothetical protein SAMN05216412_10322 [Nitrosospira multiformis]|uniref:Uncharacterized protein n=1 Tax=Nitrosospira multiformis TaxID=1231 RepID=A0A1I0BJI0_9PROT|nr:hypothetical protein SAMN05216412_10322 [Nitrosospira multiformis]